MTDHTIISVQHVTAAYGQKVVFDDISLDVRKNDFLGVIGPNGGGKTTLMRILLGLAKPQKGSVRYFRDGQPTKSLTMGYLSQYSAIDKKFPISVADVVLSGLGNSKPVLSPFTRQHRERVDVVLDELGITQLRDRHIGTLSGGQMQRVLLGRALVSRPEVMVLDEPGTYVDKRFQKQMLEMLSKLNHDCAIVLVSHNIGTTLQFAHEIALVNHSVNVKPVGEVDAVDLERCFDCPADMIFNRSLYDRLTDASKGEK